MPAICHLTKAMSQAGNWPNENPPNTMKHHSHQEDKVKVVSALPQARTDGIYMRGCSLSQRVEAHCILTYKTHCILKDKHTVF